MSDTLYISRTIHHVIVIYGTPVSNDNIFSQFFHFFKILTFWVVRGGGGRGWKGKKWSKMSKTFCPSHSISQETYIIWLPCMVQMCKMIIFQVIFLILKFWFSGLSGGRKGKNWPKMTKISLCCTLHFRNHISYDVHLWYTCMY